MTPQGAGGGGGGGGGASAADAPAQQQGAPPQAKRVKFNGSAAPAPPPPSSTTTTTNLIPTTPAAEAFSWHLVTSLPGPQLDAEIARGGREFECEYYHQLLGEDEELVGYFDPRARVFLHAQAAATWLDCREASPPPGMTAAQRTALARRRRPADLAAAMREQAYGEGNGLVTSRDAFVAAVGEALSCGDDKNKNKTTTSASASSEFATPSLRELLAPGRLLSTVALDKDPLAPAAGPGGKGAKKDKSGSAEPAMKQRLLSLSHFRLADAPLAVRRLHARLEPLLLFTVDGANTIDSTDPRWELVLAVLHGPPGDAEGEGAAKAGDDATPANPTTTEPYAIAGFMTLYNFYAYPSGQRPRVSQILVLPPLQGLGVGRRLLRAAYALAERRGARDLTFEDPSPQLQRVRERLELDMLLERAPWVVERADAALKGVLVPTGAAAAAGASAGGGAGAGGADAPAAAAAAPASAAEDPSTTTTNTDPALGVPAAVAQEAEAAAAERLRAGAKAPAKRPRSPSGPQHPLALPRADVDRLARATFIHRAQLPVLWEALLYLRLRAAAEAARAGWGAGAAAAAAAAAKDGAQEADENAAGAAGAAAASKKKKGKAAADSKNKPAPPLPALLERGAGAVAALAAARLQAQEGGSAEAEAAARRKRVVDVPPAEGRGEEWFMWRAPAGAEGEDEGAAAAMLGGGRAGGGGGGSESEGGGGVAAALARLKAAREKRKRGAVASSEEEEEEEGHVEDAGEDEEDEDEDDGTEEEGGTGEEEDDGGARGARGKRVTGAALDQRVAAALQERLEQLEGLRARPPAGLARLAF